MWRALTDREHLAACVNRFLLRCGISIVIYGLWIVVTSPR